MAQKITENAIGRSHRAKSLAQRAYVLGLDLWYKDFGKTRWSLCSRLSWVGIRRFENLDEVRNWIRRVEDARKA